MYRGSALSAEVPWSAALLLLLNLLDGFFTLTFLQLKVAEEANPLMKLAYNHSPLSFMVLKLAVVHAGVALLWANRHAKVARTAMNAGVFLYAVIVAYHLSFLLTLLTG
ncbi:MAG TPA: DUF5658 family protein [Myxococcaceae bacterium]|nr:DUF5658 family protein [Myxococcaceae bacterium]